MLNENTEIEELTSEACEKSILVKDLFEASDPTAPSQFQELLEITSKAIKLQTSLLEKTQEEYDKINNNCDVALYKIRNVDEDIEDFEKEIENLKRSIKEIKQEMNNEIKKTNELNVDTEECNDYNKEIDELNKKIDELNKELPNIDDEIRNELKRQKAIEMSLEGYENKLNELNEQERSRSKKNQMKVEELKAKIRRNSSSSNLLNDNYGNDKKEAGPSIIIHRTTDSRADELRLLRTTMEDSLKENVKIKNQISNIEQDLEAMRIENASLKTLMRELMNQNK